MSDEKEKIRKKVVRNKMKEDGAFDGRFAPKTFKEKKHEEDKKICREKIDPRKYDERDDFSDIDLFDYMADEEMSDEEIEQLIKEWKEKENPSVPLHQYLGMTEEQFEKWELRDEDT